MIHRDDVCLHFMARRPRHSSDHSPETEPPTVITASQTVTAEIKTMFKGGVLEDHRHIAECRESATNTSTTRWRATTLVLITVHSGTDIVFKWFSSHRQDFNYWQASWRADNGLRSTDTSDTGLLDVGHRPDQRVCFTHSGQTGLNPVRLPTLILVLVSSALRAGLHWPRPEAWWDQIQWACWAVQPTWRREKSGHTGSLTHTSRKQ